MRTHSVFFAALALAAAFPAIAGTDIQAALRIEQSEIEDIRRLHRWTVQQLHEARALARYLADWGGDRRQWEVDGLFHEAEGLYGLLRGPDHGGMALQAALDIAAADVDVSFYRSLLQRAKVTTAREILAFHTRVTDLRDHLADAVTARASERAAWSIVSEPLPWDDDPAREKLRREGIRFGWRAGERLFALPGPDQDELLSKAVAMGVTFVDFNWGPACDWSAIERQPGTYDFAALDAVLDRLTAHGLRASPSLGSLTGTPPDWFLAVHGDAARFTWPHRDRHGATSSHTGGINLFHPPTGESFAQFLAAYAQRLSRHADTVEGVYVSAQKEIEAIADTSAAMDTFWRDWSAQNTPWRRPEEMSGESPDEPARMRAERAREAWLMAYVDRMRKALKNGWPECPVLTPTAGDDFHRMIDARTGLSRDLAGLCRLTDHPSTATDSPAAFALLRSLSSSPGLWSHDIHSGCGTCGSAAAAHAPFQDCVRIVHGSHQRALRADFPNVWFRYPDRQMGDSGIGNHWITPRRMLQLAPILLNTRRFPAEIAVLWSQNSLRREPQSTYKSAMAWGHLLQRIHIPFDYLDEPGLAGGLPRYRVLILPNTQAMAAADMRTIRTWVHDGGILLGFGAPGRFDELGAPHDPWPLAEVFGAWPARMRVPGPIQPDRLETTHPEGSFQFGNQPPRAYKFRADLAAALDVNDGTIRAWFAGEPPDVAIVEHAYGTGRTMLSGFPLGFEYWEAAPYVLAFGLTHFRHPNYNMEQMRYERWVRAELAALGLHAPVSLPRGRFLRSQRGDDPDWYHIYRDGPAFREYFFEDETPVRSVFSFPRVREGIDNLYVGLAQTEGNYLWERGYFRSTLAGGYVTVELDLPGRAVVPPETTVVDALLGVPVPWTVPHRDARPGVLQFETWLPAAQAAAFAIAPDGVVRLFGAAQPPGDSPESLARRVTGYADGSPIEPLLVVDPEAIAAFIEDRRGASLVIGCGSRGFQPAARALADWLAATFEITAAVTLAAPRASCRHDYMDSFGWPSYGGDPVRADILIGNAQDNGLMWRFLNLHGDGGWLPLEINQDFPGPGHALVMLSMPFVTRADGRPGGRASPSPTARAGGQSPGRRAARRTGTARSHKES